MEIKYTIKIKDKHNPPVFQEELGKGVVATQVVEFKGATEETLKSPMFQKQIYEFAEELMKEWFEVKFEKV